MESEQFSWLNRCVRLFLVGPPLRRKNERARWGYLSRSAMSPKLSH